MKKTIIFLITLLSLGGWGLAQNPASYVTLHSSKLPLEVPGDSLRKTSFVEAVSRVVNNKGQFKLGGVPDVSRTLDGRVAGLSVHNTSGTFGVAPTIRLRGATSIMGRSTPLWVVDGVIVEDMIDLSPVDLSSGDVNTLFSSSLAGFNIEDIESVQVLKDVAATTLYGMRGVAGVIVVTTKKSQVGLNRIQYTGEFTYRMKPRYGNLKIMNSHEDMSVYMELEDKGLIRQSGITAERNYGIYGYMYSLMGQYDADKGEYGLPSTAESRRNYLYDAEHRNTDWFDILFDDPIMHSHTVNATVGNQMIHSYISVGAMVDPGWSKRSKANRYTAYTNTTFRPLNNLSFNVVASGSFRKQEAPGTLSQRIEGVMGVVWRNFENNPYHYATHYSRTLEKNTFYRRDYAPFNMLDELKNNYVDINGRDMKLQGEVKWEAIPDLTIAALGAVRSNSIQQEHHITDEANQAKAYITMLRNPWEHGSIVDSPIPADVEILPGGGLYRKMKNKLNVYDYRATASYEVLFNQIHQLRLFGGWEMHVTKRDEERFNGWGEAYTKKEIPSYAYEVFKPEFPETSPFYDLNMRDLRNSALFFQGEYTFREKYTLTAGLRYEKLKRLDKPASSDWHPTWSVEGVWNVHKEAFFENWKPLMSHLALKASYGESVGENPFGIIWSELADKSDVKSGSSITIEGVKWNQTLTFEKKKEFNIGLEFGLLDNRIFVSADWHKRNNTDLLAPLVTTGVGGVLQQYANYADMKSGGFELAISTRNIQTPDFSWTTDFVYSHVYNKVTKLNNAPKFLEMVNRWGAPFEGKNVRSLFSVRFAGLNDYGTPLFYDKDGQAVSNPYVHSPGDTDNALKFEGSLDPTDFGGLGNNFRYKNWSLSVFLTYSFGNVIRLEPLFENRFTDYRAHPKTLNDRWKTSDDKTSIPTIPSSYMQAENPTLVYAYNYYNFSTERVAKGDFIRLKELAVGYDFSGEFMKKAKLAKLSLKLQATNLFLLYADSKLGGQDPEFINAGGVALPSPKQFTLTVNVGF